MGVFVRSDGQIDRARQAVQGAELNQERIEAVADDADLEEVYNTERHLLYVACTRARDHLMVTGVDPASEFLDDLDS
jgi:ATP-dependent exoDNAse (exonuclease V) beta subunit